MREDLANRGYMFNQDLQVWSRPNYPGLAYSDGDNTEERIAAIIEKANDRTSLSPELRRHCTDWPSTYYLSSARSNILRPFRDLLDGDILEIGAGCGAITRFLGECGGNVLALEGSHRRAAITRSRTRDLTNVTVLAERFDEFDIETKFDVITLIGVLEYANLFTPSHADQPALAMLKRVISFLKPEGKLVIAIENQLGLKYFAGALEDHLNLAMYGIEGRYRVDQPETFGHSELTRLLRSAGFGANEFYAPFPDYKLPVSIVSEQGAACPDFDAASLAWQSIKRDPQLPSLTHFSLELAWPEVFKNNLSIDLANSFLVLSSRIPVANRSAALAYHYSTDRRPQYCKETRFRLDSQGQIILDYQGLSPSKQDNGSHLIDFVLPSTAHYTTGLPLSWTFIQTVTRDGWRMADVSAFIEKYIEALRLFAQNRGHTMPLTQAKEQLPGSFFDITPQNIIIDSSGNPTLIDAEWALKGEVELGRLLFRSLLMLVGSITRFGGNDDGREFTRKGFITEALQQAGYTVLESDIETYIELESEVQEEVTGRSAEAFVEWWPEQLLRTQSIHERLITDEARIADYHDVVVIREKQISDLKGEVAKLHDEISAYHELGMTLEAIYKSKSWRLTKPLRSLARPFKQAALEWRFRLSQARQVYASVKPHLLSAFSDPQRLKSKVQSCRAAWRVGGLREVILRIRASASFTGNSFFPQTSPAVLELMRAIVESSEASAIVSALKRPNKTTIIIPVYRGLLETARCIDSVMASSDVNNYNVLIINDASPENEMSSMLYSYSNKYSNVSLLENERNLGFVKTVNRGMVAAKNDDVVLLNSDTVVANDWLDRLVAQAYSDKDIGTVTPFSNNATICSYPDLGGWQELPESETVSKLDHAFALANPGKQIDIPTAVGFCMYIKRACLDDTGLFDEASFGTGYGEENDFCLRASRRGWRHILAADVFVFHEGEVSFSASATAKKANAMEIIRALYPNYETLIASHIAKNEAFRYRLFATAARYRLSDRPVVLFVSHVFGGGTEKHIQELANTLTGTGMRVLVLRPSPSGAGHDLTLESHTSYDRLKIGLSSQDLRLLADVILSFGVQKVHIHHTIGLSFSVQDLLALLDLPYYYTVHDFYSICPRVNLINPSKGYCADPSIEVCNACLSTEPKVGNNLEITWWRTKFGSLLNGASAVYCPSQDSARRILKYYPGVAVKVVPHERILIPKSKHRAGKPSKIRHFALLGVLAEHKGLRIIEEALKIIEQDKLPLRLVLIGYAERQIKNSLFFHQTGRYDDSQLHDLIERTDPDAFLFPSQCPETYSYTMSAAIISGRPIVAADIGALPERLEGVSKSFTYSYDLSAAQLVEYLQTIPLFTEDRQTIESR